MKTTALIEKGKDGTFTIFTPDTDVTIIGIGSSVIEAKSDFENSVQEVIVSYDAESLPSELDGIEFEYKYDIASLFNYYNFINVSKFASLVGINPSLMRQYKKGGVYISEMQIGRIETQLHSIGKELSEIRL